MFIDMFGLSHTSGSQVQHTHIYIIIYIHNILIYIYIYNYIYHIAKEVTFARNPWNSMRDCNLLGCFRACSSHIVSMQNIHITFVSWHFCA